jgi:hypothetical protein
MLIALAVAAAVAQVPASPNQADLTELHRLEVVWNEAHAKGDADALDALWATDLVVTVAGMPVMDKAESLAMVRSGRMPFLKYETSDVRVRTLGEAAVVTGRVTRERSMNGKNLTDNWRFTKVYSKSQGRWQVVAWHASPAAP